MIRVILPTHLRTLAQVDGEVHLDIEGQVTQRSILNALEARYPMLRGTIRDPVTHQRRAFVLWGPWPAASCRPSPSRVAYAALRLMCIRVLYAHTDSCALVAYAIYPW